MLKKVINNKNKTLKYKFIFVFKELIFFKSKVHIYVCFVNLVKKIQASIGVQLNYLLVFIYRKQLLRFLQLKKLTKLS